MAGGRRTGGRGVPLGGVNSPPRADAAGRPSPGVASAEPASAMPTSAEPASGGRAGSAGSCAWAGSPGVPPGAAGLYTLRNTTQHGPGAAYKRPALGDRVVLQVDHRQPAAAHDPAEP